MAITIPKDIHNQEFNKLKEEYINDFGYVTEDKEKVFYTKTEMVHTYAQNLLFWSSRVTNDPSDLKTINDIARRAICENSTSNIKNHLKENNIEKEVTSVLYKLK